MKNKRVTILLSIVAAILVLGLIIISYAYFYASVVVNNNVNVNVVIEDASGYNFTVSNNTNVSLDVDGYNMLYSDDLENNSIAFTSNNASFDVNLTSKKDMTCNYDLYWVWDEGSDAYTKTDGADNELIYTLSNSSQTYSGQLNDSYTKINVSGSYYVLSKKYEDMYIGTESISSSNSQTTTSSYTANLQFYNLNLVQDAHADKTYSGYFTVKNVECDETSATHDTLINYLKSITPVISEETKNNFLNSEDAEMYGGVWYNFYPSTSPFYGAITSGSSYFADFTMSDAYEDLETYRYIGPNPNNYIMFNGELWRIIGMFTEEVYNDNTNSYETNTNVVKIIRTEPLYENINYVDTLSNIYLYDNADYDSNQYVAKIRLDSSKIHSIDYPFNVFGSEIEESSSTNGIATSFESKLFMPRTSDYLLSTTGVSSDENSYLTCIGSDISSFDRTTLNKCVTGSWLTFASTYWTSTVKRNYSTGVETIGTISAKLTEDDGTTTIGAYLDSETELHDVYPVVYLKTSIEYVSGTGTQDDPIIIKK